MARATGKTSKKKRKRRAARAVRARDARDSTPLRASVRRHDPGLTADQREYFEELEARCEDLRHHHPLDDGEQEWTRAELERLEAERGWILNDLMMFGAWLQEPPRASRRGRPRDPEIVARGKVIAAYSLLLENQMRTKPAVDATMTLFRVSRSTIFLARKRWGPRLKRLGFDRLPEAKRRNKVRYFEQIGEDPLLRSS